MTNYQDDRTPDQRVSHPIIVWGRDRFLSGWGGARGGYSWAGWACTSEDVNRCESWVRGRHDMQYVRVGGDRPKGAQVKHVHGYLYSQPAGGQ